MPSRRQSPRSDSDKVTQIGRRLTSEVLAAGRVQQIRCDREVVTPVRLHATPETKLRNVVLHLVIVRYDSAVRSSASAWGINGFR